MLNYIALWITEFIQIKALRFEWNITQPRVKQKKITFRTLRTRYSISCKRLKKNDTVKFLTNRIKLRSSLNERFNFKFFRISSYRIVLSVLDVNDSTDGHGDLCTNVFSYFSNSHFWRAFCRKCSSVILPVLRPYFAIRSCVVLSTLLKNCTFQKEKHLLVL